MKFDIAKIFENLVSFYTKLPLAQKLALPILIAASMGLIVFVTRWAERPEYQVLYSNLSEADAGGVVERLKDLKIGYQLQDDGKTVAITPPSMVHEIRLELAAGGLPKGGNAGFELFNESKLGVTNFLEQLNLSRALQGELERTIMSIESVKAVRVHITRPERSSFVKRDTAPTASVLLRLKAGMNLTPQQVKGIAHLVAGSIERLTPENVTIMDSSGNLLNQKRDAAELNGADLTRLEYQTSIETSMAKRVESMLAEVLGAGHAVARVTADLDFSKFEKEEEAYDPSGQVMRSERAIEENAGRTAEGGVSGVVSNLTNDPNIVTPPEAGKGSAVRKESVKNFEVSRAVSRTSSAAGKLARLSVAVLVDGEYVKVPGAEKNDDGTPKLEDRYKPLSAEMLRKIENLVKQAVGFDTGRGDMVTVENIRFTAPDTSLEEALLREEGDEKMGRYMHYGVWILLTALFFFVMVKPLIQFLVTPSESEVDLSRLLPAGVEELEAELDAERSKLSALPEMAPPAVDIEELEALLAENSRLVRENPQQAALLIRYWLNDGRI